MTSAASQASSRQKSWTSRFIWTPPWLRWDPEANHDLTWGLNILFGCTAAASVANLYYTHPILNILADDFGVADQRASLIPTILQAGYAGGLLLIVPLGDITRRRPLILALMFATSLIWLGLTLTYSFTTFLGLSFVVGFLTVTPQLMFPLAIQYAPPRHRATMTSVVMSGLVFGILVARLLSGVLTQYTSWRNVYWMSFGLQVASFVLLLFVMPDYPILKTDTSYASILLTIIKLPFRSSLLTQQSFIAFMTMAMFTSFWTTLTFQLASPVFDLSTLDIGLFALIGISPVFLNPVVSRLLTSRIHPAGTLLVANSVTLAAVLVGTFVGTFSLAGPVIWAFFGDLGMNTMVVGERMAISGVDPKAQNAVNAVYMVFTFCGQLFGTAVGNDLYAQGGWVASGALSIGLVGMSFVLIFLKGPHEPGWLGWRGGWSLKLEKPDTSPPRAAEQDAEGGSTEAPASVEGVSDPPSDRPMDGKTRRDAASKEN